MALFLTILGATLLLVGIYNLWVQNYLYAAIGAGLGLIVWGIAAGMVPVPELWIGISILTVIALALLGAGEAVRDNWPKSWLAWGSLYIVGIVGLILVGYLLFRQVLPTATPTEAPAPSPTPISIEAIRTQAAGTVIAEIETAQPSPEVVFTSTPTPTATSTPTTLPTSTPLPTFTAVPAVPTDLAVLATSLAEIPFDPEVILLAEDHFVMKGVPACFPVNESWKTLFGKDGVYILDPSNPIFTSGHTYWVEGVLTGTDPLHSVFELTRSTTVDQANIWDCGVRATSSDDQLHTLAFEFADKKYIDQKVQGLSKPYCVVTPYGTYCYDDGEKPAWSPTVPDTTAPACPFKTPAKSDPAGVQQDDGSFVGAPGKAGCDFVLVSPDGKTAKRYHSAIDSFPYPAGGSFYLFDPSLNNLQVASGINSNPAVSNSWK